MYQASLDDLWPWALPRTESIQLLRQHIERLSS